MRASSLLLVLGCTACLDGIGEPGVLPLAGGATTVIDRSSNAYSFPAPNLSDEELDLHLEGDVAFEAVFVSPPATINPGLGPVFNNSACNRCHVRDGRGLPVAGQGPLGSPLLVRVSASDGKAVVPGGPVPVPGLGLQVQDHAIFGATPEAQVELAYDEVSGRYGDGEPYTLRRPRISITLANGEPLSAAVLSSARIPPPVFGLGLLEVVPDDTLRELADPQDGDGDGISGRVNEVWHRAESTTRVGRFGWKASEPTLLQQAAAAYANDMGVTSSLFPEEDGSYELALETLTSAAFYTQTLAVPARTALEDPDVQQGEALFVDVGCVACHVETLETGEHEIDALAQQRIHAYSDLLLHDVGFDLADGRTDYFASAMEWRTAPLWGLGLAQTVLPNAGLLHDGRARDLAEAILWHGGEAECAKEAFRTLPPSERAALLAFLRSL